MEMVRLLFASTVCKMSQTICCPSLDVQFNRNRSADTVIWPIADSSRWSCGSVSTSKEEAVTLLTVNKYLKSYTVGRRVPKIRNSYWRLCVPFPRIEPDRSWGYSNYSAISSLVLSAGNNYVQNLLKHRIETDSRFDGNSVGKNGRILGDFTLRNLVPDWDYFLFPTCGLFRKKPIQSHSAANSWKWKRNGD